MAQKDWKFHDYDMVVNAIVKDGREYRRYPEVHRLTNLHGGSCVVYGGNDEGKRWTRRTYNGSQGSIRYEGYATLDEALAAGIKWARRKDEEAAYE